MKQSLPIDALQADLVAACGRVRRLVLRAPTGSGKSTRIPQMLLDLNLVQGRSSSCSPAVSRPACSPRASRRNVACV